MARSCCSQLIGRFSSEVSQVQQACGPCTQRHLGQGIPTQGNTTGPEASGTHPDAFNHLHSLAHNEDLKSKVQED
ncbi:hypothetical protein MHYP_G00222590 [Metynnis hypsauchen]